jgi:hypothetical protein
MPDDTPDICISISCYPGDLYLLKGCLNSIKQYIPDVPIVLIKHGMFPTEHLCEVYAATAIEQADVDPRLRQYSYGYGLTKMVAFWHCPFEHFVHIDPDTVCWGDFLRGLPWRDYDIVYNEPHELITSFIQRTQYFDPDLVLHAFPDFPTGEHPFFNTGVFAARRGLFDLEEYLDLLEFQRKTRKSFFTDQGILNFMTFRHLAAGNLTARAWPLQAIVPVVPAQDLKRRFRFERRTPKIDDADRRVIHWAGKKPMLCRPVGFMAPMAHFRLGHLRRVRSPAVALGRLALLGEELHARMTWRHDGSLIRGVLWRLRRRLELAGRKLASNKSIFRQPGYSHKKIAGVAPTTIQ